MCHTVVLFLILVEQCYDFILVLILFLHFQLSPLNIKLKTMKQTFIGLRGWYLQILGSVWRYRRDTCLCVGGEVHKVCGSETPVWVTGFNCKASQSACFLWPWGPGWMLAALWNSIGSRLEALFYGPWSRDFLYFKPFTYQVSFSVMPFKYLGTICDIPLSRLKANEFSFKFIFLFSLCMHAEVLLPLTSLGIL